MTRKTAGSFRPSGERGTGLGKKISDSLSAQLLCGVLISILAAVLTFFAMLHLGNALLDSTVYGQPFEKKMASLQFDGLQEYVTEENITQDTIQQLNVWCHQGRRVYLTVYKDGDRLFASDVPSHAPVNSDGNRKDEDPDSEFALTLSDGTDVQAFLYYFASIRYHSVMVAVSYLSAFLAFSVCFIILVHRKLAYVKKMKSELDILAGGALEYPVTVRGNDELGQLAYGIDQMRQSILAHQRTEELTRSASSQLVTAMSHDLRTPLTSLLAYLELMDRGKYQNEEQLHQFIKKSLDQTLRIKTMADQMFEYFLVYSASGEQPDLETQDADTLFNQFWNEYAFSLENDGFTVDADFQPLQGNVQVNPDLLRRAFDNLYSNLTKYADSSRPISIAFRRTGNQAQLLLRNFISPARNHRESTNIGLNTCRRIMDYHNGSFETAEHNGIFEVVLQLPIE